MQEGSSPVVASAEQRRLDHLRLDEKKGPTLVAAAQMVVGVMDEMAQVCDSKATAETLDTGPWMPSRLGLIFLHPLVQQAQQGQGLVPTWVSSLRIIKLGRKRKGSNSRILSKQQCSLLLPLLVPL